MFRLWTMKHGLLSAALLLCTASGVFIDEWRTRRLCDQECAPPRASPRASNPCVFPPCSLLGLLLRVLHQW